MQVWLRLLWVVRVDYLPTIGPIADPATDENTTNATG